MTTTLRRVLSLIVTALALLLLTATATADPLAVGASAPMADAALLGVDGASHSLDAIKGEHGTLVIFTCNHCPYAKAWEARVASIGNDYSQKGFGVIAINPNDPARYEEDNLDNMKARAEAIGLTFPYVVDEGSRLARAFGATRTPEVFLFDADGALVYHGAIDDNSGDPDGVEARYLIDALEATAAGQTPPLQETNAPGCSIKFYE